MYPILFTLPDGFPVLGGRPIYSYGLLLGLAAIVGWALAYRRVRRLGATQGGASIVLAAGLVAGLIGARGLGLAFGDEPFDGPASLLRFDSSGSVLYGGLIAGGLAMVIAAKLTGLGPWRVLDAVTPSAALGIGLGRLGSFLHGSDYGRATPDSALAVHFPMWRGDLPLELGQSGSPAFLADFQQQAAPVYDHLVVQVERVRAIAGSALGQSSELMQRANAAFEAKFQALGTIVMQGQSHAVVPTQLLGSAIGFTALLGALVLERRWWRKGQLFAAFAVFYGTTQFGAELTRGDPLPSAVGVLSVNALLSLVVAAGFVAAGLVIMRRGGAPPSAAGEAVR